METTILNAGLGADVIHINNVSDTLVVNGGAGIDTINVNGTGAGSVSTLNGESLNERHAFESRSKTNRAVSKLRARCIQA